MGGHHSVGRGRVLRQRVVVVWEHRTAHGAQVLVRVEQRRRGRLRRDGEGDEAISIVWEG
jgi:hypothetical protein